MNIEIDLTQKEIKTFTEFFSGVDKHEAKNIMLKTAIDQYKEQRDRKNSLQSSNETLQNSLDDLKAKITSSRDLFKIKDRIEHELERFGYMGKDDGLSAKVKEMKNKRIMNVDKVLQKIVQITNRVISQNNNSISSLDSNGVRGRFLLFLSALTFITGTTLYLLIGETIIIIAGIFVSIVNLSNFFLVNMYQDVRFDKVDFFAINYNGGIGNYYQKFVEQLNRQENAFFVNAAWISALTKEKDKVVSAIQDRLGGRSFYDIDTEINKQNELIQNQTEEINKIIDSMISAEEYLKLRRESDLLKAELGNKLDTNEEINIIIRGLDRFEQKLKGTIINYLNYLRNNEIIKSISYM